jgi:hypothetical protein
MSFQFPWDKLSLINGALLLTGNNVVAAAENGSDEWLVCSPAYETGLGYIMESHSWGYATLVTVLQPSPTPPQDTDWDTAYPLPPDLVHLLWAKVNQNTTNPLPFDTAQLTLYSIMGTPTGPVLVINSQGGPPPPSPPTVPAVVTIKYISNSGALCDSTNGTPMLISTLQRFVFAGIYRGLHEEPGEADKAEATAMQLLQQARTRYDQQKPKRQVFNSRLSASRRIRRPWPATGTGGWGSGSGGGIPG